MLSHLYHNYHFCLHCYTPYYKSFIPFPWDVLAASCKGGKRWRLLEWKAQYMMRHVQLQAGTLQQTIAFNSLLKPKEEQKAKGREEEQGATSSEP
jgi:hypothetical protein